MQIILEIVSSLAHDIPEIKGHIVQLIIRGRTKLHHKINQMKDEDYKHFIESINDEFSVEKCFLWIDSIIFRTALPMQDFESLKLQNSIFQDLEEVIRLYSSDLQYKKELVKNWGAIWKEQIYTENIEEDKFDFDDEILNDIIMQARELVIEKLAEALEIT
jgi:exonuclease SbcD